MRAKSLRLIGFKSFYGDTSVGFQNSINAVVGPNGCGKSNVLDAIRWVLGEQNPRRLRAGDMGDVVSNGGESLKPLGMAEVSLTLADVKEKGFDEVVIKRRLFRSGESEYYINGTPCRLKDITEMFMDTGAGARSYSVVDQGRIEHLITAKPEERRTLIEEVAGVVKYKARRRETESHIESTKENLSRVKDVTSEVSRQMSALSKQAKDAEEFKRLSEEARGVELKTLCSKLYEIRDKEKELVGEKWRLENETASLQNGIGEREVAVKHKESEISLLEQKIEELTGEIYGAKSELQASESRRNTLQGDLSRVDEFIRKLEKETELLREEDKKIEIQIGLKGAALEKVGADLGSKGLELGQKEETTARLKAGFAESQSELDATRRLLFETLDKHSSLKAVAFGYEKELNDFSSRRDRTGREFEEAKRENESILSQISELERVQSDIRERGYQVEGAKKSIASSISKLNADYELKKEGAAALGERLKEVRSRLSVLKQVETNYEWLPEGIRRFLLEKKGNGILGVIADFVSVPKGYERALEAVFGEKLKWALVGESEEAIRAVDSLRELSIGRGTFVPVSGARRNESFEKNGKSIVPLWDIVTVDGVDKGVIENMLSGVFVVSSLREALSLRDQLEEGASFVTLDGDLLDSAGAISGGFAGEGVFQRKREIEELTGESAGLEVKIADTTNQLELCRAGIEGLESELETARKESVEIEIKEAEVKKDISNLRDNLLKAERRFEIIQFDITGIDSEIADKKGKLKEVFAEIDRLENEKARLERRFGELKEKVQEREGEEKVLEGEITNLKVEVATLVQKHTSLKEDIEELGERQKGIARKIEFETKEVERKKEEKLGLTRAGEDNKRAIEKILGVVAEKEKGLSVKKDEKDGLLYQIKTAQDEKERAAQELIKLREKSNALALELHSLDVEARHIKNSISELTLNVYKSSYQSPEQTVQQGSEQVQNWWNAPPVSQSGSDETARGDGSAGTPGGVDPINLDEIFSYESLKDFDRPREEARLRKIRERIEKFGAVNLLAPEEYKNLEDRSKFLNEQMEDLVNALSSLRKAISKIDKECAKRFNDAFEDINKKFQEIFSRLFKGGEAKLVLTDNEDALQTGVEVMVRPKGKKFQSVSLLSGGEKALSAIALVLSACFVKPAPFLLFDEIDAHLDDMNTGQFTDLLQEAAKGSQILIITHNKKTMQIADSLIGITSDKPGVSKVVSVELRGS